MATKSRTLDVEDVVLCRCSHCRKELLGKVMFERIIECRKLGFFQPVVWNYFEGLPVCLRCGIALGILSNVNGTFRLEAYNGPA